MKNTVGVRRNKRQPFLLMATIALWMMSSPLAAEVAEGSEPLAATTAEQILWLDLEILLLKAELAQKSGQVQEVRLYLSEIQKNPLPKFLESRLAELVAYSQKQVTLPQTSQQVFAFQGQHPLVLLPLSGPYQAAGEQILAGLKSAFTDDVLQVIDTAIYEDAFELWELVKLIQPSFIFGPLRPDFAQAFAQLATQIPTLVLNEVTTPHTYIKYFSPSRTSQLPGLVKIIQKNGFRKVLLLTQRLDTPLTQTFLQAIQSNVSSNATESVFEVISAPLKVSVDQTLELYLGASLSKSRRAWLQKTLEEPLAEEFRARQDIDMVISLMPFRSALQVSPILDYYHLNTTVHLWVPSELPTVDVFSANLPFWQETQAMLPQFFMTQVSELQALNFQVTPDNRVQEPYFQTELLENSVLNKQSHKVGIFYAFGQVAAEVVQKMANSSLQQMPTPLGEVQWDVDKNIQLAPSFYWLDKGAFTLQAP